MRKCLEHNSVFYSLFWKCILASLQKSLSTRFSQWDLQHHIKPVLLRLLHGSMTPLSSQFVPLMESVYTQAAEGKRFDRRSRNNHASSAVCENGAQREIKWISLFQDDRLPYCLGLINCESPASQSLCIRKTIPADCLRAGKLFKCSGPQWKHCATL